jgi:formylglycine-generating enzyme required for sulfatase activity
VLLVVVAALLPGCQDLSNQNGLPAQVDAAADSEVPVDVEEDDAPVDVPADVATDVPADTADTPDPPRDTADADTPPLRYNPCGGFSTLIVEGAVSRPGDECGVFDDGVLVCNGPEALRCILASTPNECGGPGALPAPLGQECGCGGVTLCADDGGVECANRVQPNACGGCAPLLGRPGFFCETATTVGRYVCLTLDSLICVGGAGNGCGGEGTLEVDGTVTPGVFPGDVCDSGTCGTGRYVCNGQDGLRCQPDRPCNSCGGVRSLAGEPDAPCGLCGEGTWACDGPDRVVCDGATPPNACGGCDALESSPGTACLVAGAGGNVGLTLCRDGATTCSPLTQPATDAGLPTPTLNGCGGERALLIPAGLPDAGQPATLGDPCGTCGRGELVCDGANAVLCTVPEARQTNVCSGCAPINARPNTPCGTCGTGRLQCDITTGPNLNNRLLCQGDLAASGRNACGGCGTLPGVVNHLCGTCLVWACDGARLECSPLTDGPECAGVLACADLDCADSNRACVETDGIVDAVCGGCAIGYVDDGPGGCRSVRTCADLDCAAELRECAQGTPGDGGATPGRDAVCGACESGAIDDGTGVCRPLLTCAILGCADEGRVCTEANAGAATDATCGNCQAGLIDADGTCRAPFTCADLACATARNRECTPETASTDALCSDCSSGFVEQDGTCRALITCATLATSCTALNRGCTEGSIVAGTDAVCAGCAGDRVEETPGGNCRSVRTCAALNCAADNRECTPESLGVDAVCEDCVEGFTDLGDRCAPVNCGGLTPPENGSVFAPDTTFDNVASYECDEGYDLIGDTLRSCGADGAWSGAAPTCAAVSCGVLGAPENGTVSAGGTTFGIERVFSCNNGYVRSGAGSSICTAAGVWSNAAPSCLPVDCGELTAPGNGTMNGTGTTLGSVRTFGCEAGFTVTGSASRTCGADGLWSGALAVCQGNDCGATPAVVNASVQSVAGSTQGATATYTCDAGYVQSGGSPTLTCGPTGWEGTPLECEALDCGAPPAVTRASVVTPVGTGYQGTATYACEAGTRLQGNASITCQATGTWSTAPTCAPVVCPEATPVNGGRVLVDPPTRTVGGLANHTCNEPAGFVQTGGNTQQQCTDPGGADTIGQWTWQGSPLVCSLRECPSFDIANATESAQTPVGPNGRSVGAEVQFSCAAGYVVAPNTSGQVSTSRTCGTDGAWTGGLPTCVRRLCATLPSAPAFTSGAPTLTRPGGEAETVSSTLASWACQFGYTATGAVGGAATVLSTCGNDGTWSAVAGCQPVDCGVLAAPENGSVSTPGGTRFGQAATVACDAGYFVTGTAPRTCGAGGTWVGAAPACECLIIHRIGEGSGTTKFMQLYNCGSSPLNLRNYSYRVRINSLTSWGAWANLTTEDTPLAPGAVRLLCNTATFNAACNNPTGFVVGGFSWDGDDRVQVRLTATNTLVDAFGGDAAPESTTSWGDRVWSRLGCSRYTNTTGADFSEPLSAEVFYPSVELASTGGTNTFGGILGVPPSPAFSCPLFASGTACTFDAQCQYGSLCAGSPGAAVCSPIQCGAPPTLANATVSAPQTAFGSVASYSCDSGFTSTTAINQRTCGVDGQWTGEVGCVSNTALCSSDAQCGAGSWCPTNTLPGLRRCSPRLFSGQAHQMDFVFVPAGTFVQGTPGATNDEQPYTATITRNYWVSRTEVTQGQWAEAMTAWNALPSGSRTMSGWTGDTPTFGTTPSCFQTSGGTSCATGTTHSSGPVERVSWWDAVVFANVLSRHAGLQECYTLLGCSTATGVAGVGGGCSSGICNNEFSCTAITFTGLSCTGYRLLTESEWERGARGGSTSAYYWGRASDTATVGQYVWFTSNAGGRTQPVAQKMANPFGLYEMIGNVQEWVLDGYASSYPSDSATDYIEERNSYALVRGGDWNSAVSNLRSADRDFEFLRWRDGTIGVRLARTVP